MGDAGGNMVFFNQLVMLLVKVVDRLQPAPGNLISQRILAVTFKSLDRHPLQRRPAVGFIPLLTAFVFGGHDPPGGEQAGPHRIGKAFCLFVGRQADVKGDDTGCGKQRQLFTAPVIIAETAVLIIPQIAVDRRPPILGLLAEGRLRLAIALQAGEVGNGRLQLEQEGVQVDGDKLRRADAGQPRDIPQPAAGVVPAGRGARPQVAVHFIGGECRAVSTSSRHDSSRGVSRSSQ